MSFMDRLAGLLTGVLSPVDLDEVDRRLRTMPRGANFGDVVDQINRGCTATC